MLPKVLFASSEAAPLAKVGGLGDVAGALPKALKDLGVDVRVIIPKYHSIETPRHLPESRVPIYYVSSPKYFGREQIYGYEDDAERFSFFCRGLLEETKKVGFEPDIIHLNDYHTSLVPFLLSTSYNKEAFFAQSRTLLTIHNLANQGLVKTQALISAGLEMGQSQSPKTGPKDPSVNMLLNGISRADKLVAVSPTYAKEILTPEYGEGLENSLQEREADLSGILNGIDVAVYNSETDANLVANYSVKNLSKRSRNKVELARVCGFQNDWPIMGLVSRLVAQKGLDILSELLPELSKMPLNLIVLGVGEERFEKSLLAAAKSYPNMAFWREFSEAKSRLIYAGSDFFLVPSRFEPCGLTQMVAMRYGSIPIVRKTGGLADTVTDGKTGFVFEKYSSEELLKVIKKALETWSDKRSLEKLQRGGIEQDFSWVKSAKEYVKLYQKAEEVPKNFV